MDPLTPGTPGTPESPGSPTSAGEASSSPLASVQGATIEYPIQTSQ